MKKEKIKELNLVGENEKWLNILIKNKEDEKEFINDTTGQYYNKQSPMVSMLRFRKHLLEDKKRNQDLTVAELDKVVKTGDKEKMIEVLSDLFLEPISINELNHFIDSALTADELIQLHRNNLTNIHNRFVCLVTASKFLLEKHNKQLFAKAI